jgi:hypothetical protein
MRRASDVFLLDEPDCSTLPRTASPLPATAGGVELAKLTRSWSASTTMLNSQFGFALF